MNRDTYYEKHRQARLGNLGTLAMTTSGKLFQWFLHEVYDLRFPHIGDRRHLEIETFKWFGHNWRGRLHRSLEAWHNKRGWWHCGHKSLIRLWTEYKAINKI